MFIFSKSIFTAFIIVIASTGLTMATLIFPTSALASSATELKEGDCLDVPAKVLIKNEFLPKKYGKIDCNLPHTAEVLQVGTLPVSVSSSTKSALKYVDSLCYALKLSKDANINYFTNNTTVNPKPFNSYYHLVKDSRGNIDGFVCYGTVQKEGSWDKPERIKGNLRTVLSGIDGWCVKVTPAGGVRVNCSKKSDFKIALLIDFRAIYGEKWPGKSKITKDMQKFCANYGGQGSAPTKASYAKGSTGGSCLVKL